ncbi:MAG: hypothetical protein ACRD2C_06175 [Acidimicrobiales bacterium]
MSVAGRRIAVVGAAFAVLFGVFLHRVDLGLSEVRSRDHRPAVVLVDSAPAAVAPVAVRGRALVDTAPVLRAGPIKLALGSEALLAAGLAVAVAGFWCVTRPDRRLAPPMQRSAMAPLRAPPAVV